MTSLNQKYAQINKKINPTKEKITQKKFYAYRNLIQKQK